MAAAPASEETTFSHFSNVFIKDVSPQMGKGVFAKKYFREGELIFEERPLVCSQFLWNSLYKYTACSNCLRSLETAEQMARRLSGNDNLQLPYASKCCEITRMGQKTISCQNCQVKYCSEECRQCAWDQYHRTLCLGQNEGDPSHPLEQLQETWRKMHYPPETASVMLIAQMIATVLQAPDPKKMQDTFESFCHSVVNRGQKIVHKLLGDQFKEQLDILRVQMSNALYDEKLEEWFKMDGFLSLMALIGINGQGIGTSSLSVYVHNLENLGDISEDERQALDVFIDQLYEEMDNVSGQFLNCEGSGLYALQSSCEYIQFFFVLFLAGRITALIYTNISHSFFLCYKRKLVKVAPRPQSCYFVMSCEFFFVTVTIKGHRNSQNMPRYYTDRKRSNKEAALNDPNFGFTPIVLGQTLMDSLVLSSSFTQAIFDRYRRCADRALECASKSRSRNTRK
ncbi:SET and MYND domain-containing protein 5-like isoform X1 [Stylophora pistillata]|uniref:SET and MYND domain-containing protein 5-like isoform X1 n=1 Tax=Stylophora pistillata TaxID=50429 RepID=UPI000C03B663|nr:SET and MYND domain-containing protein 5-like isoform X1 [Stylophora pistillata]